MKILIVGGVAGGASAATRLRRLDEKAEIILFEKGPYISYANCGLPYYLSRAIDEPGKLLVTTPDFLKKRFLIDVRVSSEVVTIDRVAKIVTVKNVQTGKTYAESYDKLILSPGAKAKKPTVEGLSHPGVFTLRTIPDTLALDEYVKTTGAQRAVVVGAGFIGVEAAENLRHKGLSVTLVEFQKQALAFLDAEMAAFVHRELRGKSITLRFGAGLSGITQKEGGALSVALSDGGALETDIVLLALGVSPETELAKDADIALGVGGAIKVSTTYQTSDPDILAVGDAIEVTRWLDGEPALIPLAGPANRQGRLAAAGALGRLPSGGKGVKGASVVKVFDVTAASVGLNEKQLKQANVHYLRSYIHPAHHATYYPGAEQMSLKILFDEAGKILGAQGVGGEGVDKRIDVISTAMHFGATVYDLEELELCYAPPYGAAKDPVNMLGFTAANILRGDVKPAYFDEIDALERDKVTILDVSTPPEVRMGTLPGSVNIPLDALRERLGELDKQKPVYVCCRVGLRGYLASRILLQNGFDAYNVSGGYRTYRAYAADQAALAEAPVKATPPKVDCFGVPLGEGGATVPVCVVSPDQKKK